MWHCWQIVIAGASTSPSCVFCCRSPSTALTSGIGGCWGICWRFALRVTPPSCIFLANSFAPAFWSEVKLKYGRVDSLLLPSSDSLLEGGDEDELYSGGAHAFHAGTENVVKHVVWWGTIQFVHGTNSPPVWHWWQRIIADASGSPSWARCF